MKLLRKLGYPISIIYGFVVFIRNRMFDMGILKSQTFGTPTICVGNLSVGGTGKTPMIEYLIALLKAEKKLAVLSRGYGRKSKGFIKADASVSVHQLGDEPYQIHKKYPEVVVAVDADRRRGISKLEAEEQPDLILLDDAFQHRKVKPSFSIVLTAYGQLYVHDQYLPTGNLRDNKREAQRANVIVVTKCPSTLGLVEQKNIEKALGTLGHQHVLFSTLDYDPILGSSEGNLPFSTLADKKITLVTGIANPAPLVTFLEGLNLNFEHLEYPDHHFFTPKELREFNGKTLVLTTEKDYVRLRGKVEHLYYIRIEHLFLGDGKQQLISALNVL